MAEGDKRGGKRAGSGRKPGALTKKTRAIAARELESGLTPLEYFLTILRTELGPDAEPSAKAMHEANRFEAAKMAAPYMHPRLSSINSTAQVQGNMNITIVSEFDD